MILSRETAYATILSVRLVHLTKGRIEVARLNKAVLNCYDSGAIVLMHNATTEEYPSLGAMAKAYNFSVYDVVYSNDTVLPVVIPSEMDDPYGLIQRNSPHGMVKLIGRVA